jgi:hypothetical protein
MAHNNESLQSVSFTASDELVRDLMQLVEVDEGSRTISDVVTKAGNALVAERRADPTYMAKVQAARDSIAPGLQDLI